MYAIVPAGGAGSRLWPLSRRSHPKFLLDLAGGGRSMLQATLDRLAPLTSGSLVVTGEAHAAAVAAQVGGAEVIAEPSPRDSMAAIGLATAIIHERHGDTVVGSFAADHVIADGAAFCRAVRAAIEVAESGYLVTLGIAPSSPSPAFGYIRPGAPLPGLPGLAVTSFEEKPAAETALRYLAEGYLWNAGMFVMSTAVALGALAALEPELHAGLTRIARSWDTPRRERVLAETWGTLPRMVIDRALAEPLAARGRVAVVPAAVGWSDIGDFSSLAQLAPRPADVEIDAPSSYVRATKPVVVLGVEGAVVIETDSAILVTRREHAQRVKEAVDALPAAGLAGLT